MLNEAKIGVVLNNYNKLVSDLTFLIDSREQLDKKRVVLAEEMELLKQSEEALLAVKPLLREESLSKCIELCNLMFEVVFEVPYKIRYSEDTRRFILDKGDYSTDLVTSEGGGYVSAVSYIVSLFLLLRSGRRKVMFFDEQFQQISQAYIARFIDFMRKSAHDLGIDILFISHDARIDESMVDHVYQVAEGTVKRLK